jgi:hypothetical protein
MKKLLLSGIAALFLATGAASAQSYRGPTTANDPLYKIMRPYDPAKDYRPNYDPHASEWTAADPPPETAMRSGCEKDEECAAECMKTARTKREIANCRAIVEADMTPAICFIKMTKQNAGKLFEICGDLSDCGDGGWCEALERDRRAHVRAGRLICNRKKECKLARVK